MTSQPRPAPLPVPNPTAAPSTPELAQALRLVGEALRSQMPAGRFVRPGLRLPQL